MQGGWRPGGTFRTAIGPLMFFESNRGSLPDGGSTAELNFGFGIAVLLIILAGFVAVLAWLKQPVQKNSENSQA